MERLWSFAGDHDNLIALVVGFVFWFVLIGLSLMRVFGASGEAVGQGDHAGYAVYAVQATPPAPVQGAAASADALAASVERTKIISTAVCAGLAIIAAVVAIGIGCATAVMLSRRIKAHGAHCAFEVSEDGRLGDREASAGLAAGDVGVPDILHAEKEVL